MLPNLQSTVFQVVLAVLFFVAAASCEFLEHHGLENHELQGHEFLDHEFQHQEIEEHEPLHHEILHHEPLQHEPLHHEPHHKGPATSYQSFKLYSGPHVKIPIIHKSEYHNDDVGHF